MTRGECREDFRVLVGAKGSSLAAVCLGPVVDRGGPEDYAREMARSAERSPPEVSFPWPTTVVGQPAWEVRTVFSTATLTDWLLAYEGWLFVIGTLCHWPDDEGDVLARSHAALETWRWTDPPLGA